MSEKGSSWQPNAATNNTPADRGTTHRQSLSVGTTSKGSVSGGIDVGGAALVTGPFSWSKHHCDWCGYGKNPMTSNPEPIATNQK